MDENLDVKLADFGFTAPRAGRDGSGVLKTALGTRSYMAPEILKVLPYEGAKVDVFALGVILFIMIRASPPFRESTDKYYELLWQDPNNYWTIHNHEFGEDFIDLFTGMVHYDPN